MGYRTKLLPCLEAREHKALATSSTAASPLQSIVMAPEPRWLQKVLVGLAVEARAHAEDDGIEEMVKIEAMEYGSDDEGDGVNQKSTSRGTMVENTASGADLVPKT